MDDNLVNLLWMILVGGVIGAVASVFVRGYRSTGLVGSIFLGMLGYALGGILSQHLGQSLLPQWVWGIAFSLLFLVSYTTWRNAVWDRHHKQKSSK